MTVGRVSRPSPTGQGGAQEEVEGASLPLACAATAGGTHSSDGTDRHASAPVNEPGVQAPMSGSGTVLLTPSKVAPEDSLGRSLNLLPAQSPSAAFESPQLGLVGRFLAIAPMLLHDGRSYACPPPVARDWWAELVDVELAGPALGQERVSASWSALPNDRGRGWWDDIMAAELSHPAPSILPAILPLEAATPSNADRSMVNSPAAGGSPTPMQNAGIVMTPHRPGHSTPLG